ncbi:MAG: ATP-binding cassette domain-containing protein [Candidatus Solibacter sp.]
MTHARIAGSELEIDLALPDGITALHGPAGSGKTALLESIAGFRRPARGRILVGDAIVFDAEAGVNLPARQRRCGWVGANEALFPHMTVRQNLLFAAGRWAPLERTRRVAEMLERFELADTLEMRPHHLSAARRLRVEVARALMSEPRALLLDRRQPDEALLRLLAEAFDGPALIVMDSLDLCYAAGCRLALIEGGHLAGCGPARDLMERPENADAARLAGFSNVYAATVAALDPGRNHCRLECQDFVLSAPYLKGHLNGDRVWVGIRAEDVRVHTDSMEADINYVPVALLRVLERPRTVRLEFAGGIAAEISREQFARQKDNKGWQVEFPPAALRVF